MRSLLAICAGLVVILGVVSGKLWTDLRTERQLVSHLREQMNQPKPAGTAPAQSLPGVDANPATAVSAPVPDSRLVSAAVQPAPAPAPVVSPMPANQNPPVINEARRAAAMADSDQTATARVLRWKDRLEIDGQSLTTVQLQALNAAAIAQLRRETQQNLELESTARPTDLETVIRLREDQINRQNETNLRILRVVTPQLSEEQAKALRAQFDAGHAARMTSFRAEKEQIQAQAQAAGIK
jgi:hypothetical protein